MPTIADNIRRVRERIERAAARAGIHPASIRLVAVSKTKPVEAIEEAIAAGLTDIGENRIQEAQDKYERIGARVAWHMIGHLQTNKVRHAVRFLNMIQSVDSMRLGQEIHRRAAALEKTMPVLIQVKTSMEETKAGIDPDDVFGLLEALSPLSGLSIQGLMTIPAFSVDPEDGRAAFSLLRALHDRIEQARIPGVEMRYLSMGMTHDFEVAIEEGANMIRVGTAIFGERAA